MCLETTLKIQSVLAAMQPTNKLFGIHVCKFEEKNTSVKNKMSDICLHMYLA